MPDIKAIIVEDERPAARRLTRMLNDLGVEVLATLHTVEESKEWFRNHAHEGLIFLDIQLSDGLSFEIFEDIDIQNPIIFTTAYDEYALQAFKLNSIDYLLKPIDQEELEKAIKQYRTLNGGDQRIQLDFEDIKKLLVNPLERDYKKRFTARVGQHIKILPAADIECFYSENKGTYAATSEGRNYLLDTTLEQLEEELTPEKFYVNLDHIQDIISYTNSRLKIKMNTFEELEIIVSRERVRDFKLWLE